jgi:hypothetical protein
MKIFKCNRCNTERQGLTACLHCGSYEFRILYPPGQNGKEESNQSSIRKKGSKKGNQENGQEVLSAGEAGSRT